MRSPRFSLLCSLTLVPRISAAPPRSTSLAPHSSIFILRSFCHRRDSGVGHKVFSLATFNTCVAKERTRLSVKAVESEATILRVDVNADGVAAGVEGGEHGGAGTGEGVEDRVAVE